LTGRENILLGGAVLGMTRTETARKFDEIVAFAELELFLDTPLKRYSTGMQVRLAFAVAAHLEPEILLADEVLAVGDQAFQAKCLGKMSEVARGGRTVIFVSHSMAAVSRLCGRVLVLEGGRTAALEPADEAIQSYYALLQVTGGETAQGSHVLFAESRADDGDFAVTRVELLDEDRRPKPVVATWDDVVVRIWYRCRVPLRRAAVEFEVSGVDGSTLLLLSTQPDSTVPVEFSVGEHCADCLVRRLPLAAGRYSLGAALAIPQMEYLWRRRHLASFTVIPRDVYGSGQAPHLTRSLLAVQHAWSVGDGPTAPEAGA
jgi:lipopolysaccharide transport system ATP-binding protein